MPIIKNKNIFITGYPGSGKTTLFNEIINGIKKIKPDIIICSINKIGLHPAL